MNQNTTLKGSFNSHHDTQELCNNEKKEDLHENDISKRMGVLKTLILAQFISRGFVVLNDSLYSIPKQPVFTHFKRVVDDIEDVMKEFHWEIETFDQIMADLIATWIKNPFVTEDKNLLKKTILASIESHHSEVEAEGICEVILEEKDEEIACQCIHNYECTKCYPNLCKEML